MLVAFTTLTLENIQFNSTSLFIHDRVSRLGGVEMNEKLQGPPLKSWSR